MPDLLTNVLKVNQPANNGFDNNTVRNNPIVPGDTQIKNMADPSKIVRTDGKTEAEDKRFAFSSESNYGNFISNLQDMPRLAELFSKFLFIDAQTIITSGMGEDFANQISAFMEMIQMDPEQLTAFLKEQAADSGKFSGVFFQTLRDLLNGTGSLELRTEILNFLKHYSDMASSEHLLRNIMAELNDMKPYMFKTDAQELSELQARLLTGQGGENGKQKLVELMDQNIRENSRLLKEEIIPFFSKYISKTKDLGTVRDIMTLVTLNTARYANGTRDNVLQCFERLLKFGDFKSRLGDIKEENLENIINRMLVDQKDGERKPWTERFLDMLQTGIRGEGGYESKVVFQNVMNAMLLNESVYMPLLHLMIPVNLNGNIMFSEMWVDPDAGETSHGAEESERSIRMLVKFDIKDLGFFDLVLNYQGGKVDMLVSYPPKLSAMEKMIRNGLSQIGAENGLSFQSLTLEKGGVPIPLMDVFPKISEGRNSVNVRI